MGERTDALKDKYRASKYAFKDKYRAGKAHRSKEGRSVFSVKRPRFGGDVTTIFIVIIYMSLIYTANGVFANAVAGSHGIDAMSVYVDGWEEDLQDVDNETSRGLLNALPSDVYESMSRSDIFDHMNNTHDGFDGKYIVLNWLDTGWYYQWNDDFKIIDWKFDKYLNGTLEFTDASNQEMFGSFLGNVLKIFTFMWQFMTFGILTSEASAIADFSFISWLFFFMAVPVWLYVFWILFPYMIELMKVLVNLIDALIPL